MKYRLAGGWFEGLEQPRSRPPWGAAVWSVLLALSVVALVVAGCPAQGRVAVANPAAVDQVRWVTYAVPLVEGDELQPMACGSSLAVPGRALGVHSQLWHVRADVAAGAVLRLEDWHPAPASDATVLPVWSPPTDPELVPTLLLQDAAGLVAMPATSARIVDRSPVHETWRLEVHREGWHLTAWETRWLGQAAVDVAGYVTWSDPRRPQWFLDDVAIGVGWTAPATLHGAKRQGLVQLTAGAWMLWRGRVPHAFGFPFRGTLRGGGAEPLVAAAAWPDGTWLAFGCRPDVPAVPRARLDGVLAGAGSLLEGRLGASSVVTGSTGGQACFGAVKGLSAASGDPWGLRELLWTADDGVLRTGHHLELDGAPVTLAKHPRWETWSLAPETNAGDKLGKPRGAAPWGWDRVGERSVLIDDQHRGDLPEVAAFALTGDWLLGEDLALRFNADEAAAKMLRGQTDQPRSARVELSLAHWSLLVDEETAARVRARAARQLDLRLAAWEPGGPARWLFHLKDDRVLPDFEAGVPWQDGIWCTSALAQARAFARLGDHDLAARFEAAAGEVARVVAAYGVLRDDGGRWLGLTGVRWLPGGAANPPEYFRYPRAGAGTDAKPGIDMLVGGGGWIDWMAPAFVFAGTERAREVREAVAPRAGASEDATCWWAMR